MHIFSRTAQAKPEHVFDAAAFAVEVAGKVTSITGKPVSAFSGVYGHPLGTVVWSVRADSQAELADDDAKILGDPGYVDLVQRNIHLFDGPATDQLVAVVSSSLAPTPKPIYSLLTATIANGKFTPAMAFGVKAQAYVAKSTGLANAFTSSVFGAFGAIGWLTGAASMADVDRYTEWQATDPGFHALVDEASDLFIPGSGQSSLIKRLN